MMKGATIPRPYHQRKSIEATTMPASHAQTGTRRALSTKLDLGQAPGELGRLGRVRLDSDVRRGVGNVGDHLVGDVLTAHRLLQGGDVELGDPLEIVLACDERERSRRHRRARALVAG